jgi:transcriptional regulator with XRE-family HTH domain
MTTSGQMEFLSEILEWKPIPQDTMVYFSERLRHRLHAAILDAFSYRAQEKGFKQADLARRIHKTRAQIGRWLSTQSNLTLDSISDLMVGLGMDFDAFPFTPIENTVVAKEEKCAGRETKFRSLLSLPETNMELTSEVLSELTEILKNWNQGIYSSAATGAIDDATKKVQEQARSSNVYPMDEYRPRLRPKSAGKNDNTLLQVGAR